MGTLVWGTVGQRTFETGTDRGVLYPMSDAGTYPKGVVWNGLTGVSESPSGAEANAKYADNIKYFNLVSAEEYAATINAFGSPKEFDACDGTAEIAKGVFAHQQTRKPFGFSWRTLIGNDVDGQEHGYKIHIVYNAMAKPASKDYETVNDSPEALTLSWELSTTPVAVPGYKPTAKLTIDSTLVDAVKLKALEDKLYGTATLEASLPSPAEIITLIGAVVAG